MVTKDQVLEALKKVMDPELHRSIVDLGMVREIAIKGSTVKVTIALTVPNCPLQDTIGQDVAQAVEALAPGLDVEILMRAMTDEERRQLQQRLRGSKQPEPASPAAQLNRVRTVVAVMSGKGGVGKSTVTALLAVALRARGLRVGILDADITGPSIPKLFGMHEAPAMTPLGIMPPTTENGIKIMSINLLLPSEDEAVIWRGPLINSAIQQFWNDVFWGDLDILLADMPPGTSDAALAVMQNLPLAGILLVTSPQDLAEMVVRKAAKMAYHMEKPVLGIVENMSYAVCPHCGKPFEIFGRGQMEETAILMGTSFLGRLPIDSDLTRRCDEGRVEEYEIPAEFHQVVETVAARIAEMPEPHPHH